MYRRSTNNMWIPPGGMNSGTFAKIGGEDPMPGAGARYDGLLGQTVVHSDSSALKDSKLTIGTLFNGVYQLVKFHSAVVNVLRGQLLFWDTLANNGLSQFQVTNVPTAASFFRAGVCLFSENAVGGKYAYMQVAGLSSMLYANAAVGTIGLPVIQATAVDTPLLTVATVNTSALATAQLTEDVVALVGLAYETPTQNAVRRVLMNSMGFYPNIG